MRLTAAATALLCVAAATPGDYSTCSVPVFSGTLMFGGGAVRR